MEFIFGIIVGVFVTYTVILKNDTLNNKAIEYVNKVKSFFTSSSKEDK